MMQTQSPVIKLFPRFFKKEKKKLFEFFERQRKDSLASLAKNQVVAGILLEVYLSVNVASKNQRVRCVGTSKGQKQFVFLQLQIFKNVSRIYLNQIKVILLHKRSIIVNIVTQNISFFNCSQTSPLKNLNQRFCQRPPLLVESPIMV